MPSTLLKGLNRAACSELVLGVDDLEECFEAICIYCQSNHAEEPYVSITKKRQLPKNGFSEEIEKEVGQAEGKLFTHRSAFSRASVIQAFLGSAPQLTLQLYISVLQQNVTIGRGCYCSSDHHNCIQGFMMSLSLLSIVYGALRCNILAIKIKYDEYEVKVKPLAYLCIFLWRSFEIATRVVVLVLFTSVLKTWVVIVILVNFFSFFLYPWINFWCSGSPFPENIEKALTRVGTTIVLCFLTLLYSGINMFCWSAVQLKIDNPDLISKSQNWYRLLVYYMMRFIENAILLLLWYFFKTDIYMYVCAPLLVLQLLIGYCTAILFMLVFYQFFHPCKKLFSTSVSEGFRKWIRCTFWFCRWQKPCELEGKTDEKSSGGRDETPSSSKLSPEPSHVLSAEDLCSA
ncbi:membrane transport protein XK [Tupaia chinensis]|uniref:membrane transport protein XK n=1 Tax=Tupaia chinensis TaxID=246437 RepID=UPI000FFC2133|nr:membrane transport protein XK [Tupaia chinensis]